MTICKESVEIYLFSSFSSSPNLGIRGFNSLTKQVYPIMSSKSLELELLHPKGPKSLWSMLFPDTINKNIDQNSG